MADVNPVLDAASRFSATNRAAAVDVNQAFREQFDLYQTISNNTIAAGQATAVVEGAKQTGILETQAAVDLGAFTLGTDMRLNTEKLTDANARLIQSLAVRDEALAAVNEKQRVGLFDNPIGWLLNQITVNDDIAKYNAANAEVETNAERIKRLTDATNAEVTTQNALRHTTSQAASVAAAEKTRLDAESLAATARIKGFEVNAAGVNAAVAASKEELNAQNIAYHAVLAQEASGRANEELALSRENAQQRRDEWAFRKDQLAEALKNKKDVELAKQEMLDTVNIGLQAIGAQPINNPSTIARFMLQAEKSGTVPDEFLDAFKRGRRSALEGRKVVASDGAELVDILRTTNIKWQPIQEPIKTAMQDVVGQVLAEVNSPAGIPGAPGKKDKGSIDARINQLTRDIFDGYRAKIVPGDKDNPYNVGAITDVLQLDGVKTLPVVAKVLAPVAATSEGAESLNDPVRVAALVADAVEKGTISYKDAAVFSVSSIYQRANAINNEARQFKALGLPENQSYFAKLPTPRGFKQTVDMANEQEWARYLNKILAERLYNPETGLGVMR